MPKMMGARLMAETVHGYGLTHAFFMPYIVPRALGEMQNLGMTVVQTHGEKAAAYMADGYARAKRAPGLCLCQSVGAMNLAAGLQDAYLGQSPVIAISGREMHVLQGKNAYQEVDHVSPFSAVTKSSAYVAEPRQLTQALRQAFRTAVSGTPGPVHIDLEGRTGIPIAEREAEMEVGVDPLFSSYPPFRPEADVDSVKKAIQLLGEAKRPIIVAGGGITSSNARAELIAFAEKMSIPVATALNAKAMFPPDHPLAVGTPGTYSRACANKALYEADLVFFIGSHTGSQVTNHYRVPAPGTPTIELNINAAEIGRNFPVKVGLQGDVQATLRRMIENVGNVPARTAWVKRVQELVAEWKAEMKPLFTSEILPMRPERLCREIENNLPSNAILVSDTGHAGIWTGAYIDLKHEDQMYLRCAGSLGWGFPASLGAKCAQPDRPVVCFTGDGGFWYHLQELDTARKYGINTVTVVNNNHSLNQEKSHNEHALGGRSAQSDGFWLFPETDFAKVAESMECVGITVNKPSEFAGALDRAFSAKKPVVIDVKTNVDGIAPHGWVPA
jgi:acetolactate synthase-1/2/3 large subunit